VLLSRLCQGAETPEEAIGILGGRWIKYICHGRYAAECNMITNKQTVCKCLPGLRLLNGIGNIPPSMVGSIVMYVYTHHGIENCKQKRAQPHLSNREVCYIRDYIQKHQLTVYYVPTLPPCTPHPHFHPPPPQKHNQPPPLPHHAQPKHRPLLRRQLCRPRLCAFLSFFRRRPRNVRRRRQQSR